MTEAFATVCRIAQSAKRLGRDRRGTILIELAFALPVLVVIVMGSYDAARYVLLHQKLDRAAASMADLVSQPNTFNPDTDIAVLFSAANELVRPFDLANEGRVIVSSVAGQAGADPIITWQRDGAGSLAVTSEIGAESGPATLPATIPEVREDETLIVAEVFFDYEPLLFDAVFQPGVISHSAFRRPRQR